MGYPVDGHPLVKAETVGGPAGRAGSFGAPVKNKFEAGPASHTFSQWRTGTTALLLSPSLIGIDR